LRLTQIRRRKIGANGMENSWTGWGKNILLGGALTSSVLPEISTFDMEVKISFLWRLTLSCFLGSNASSLSLE
jgi:hypothetical protein